MKHIVDGIVVCRKDGMIENASLEAARIIGGHASDMVGKSLDSLLAEDDVTAAAKTDIKLRILAETGRIGEFRRDDGCGDAIRAEVAATSLELGKEEILIVTLRDITDEKEVDAEPRPRAKDRTQSKEALEDSRRAALSVMQDAEIQRQRAEEVLRKSESLFKSLTDHAPNAVFLKDGDGRFIAVNKRFEEWYGVSPEEALGKTSHDIFPEAYASNYVSMDRETLSQSRLIEREVSVPFADGTIRQVITLKFPVFDDAGNSVGVATITTDITEQRRHEELLRQSQKMDAVGQLTGGVAHDFNNLLAIIQGNISLLDAELDDDSEFKELTAPILRATRRGASLTNRLLAFSRKQTLDVRSVDAGNLVEEASEMLRRSLGEDISIELVIAPDLWHCTVDAGQLEQAIVNLANNARDAMLKGDRLTFEVSNTAISELQAAQETDLAPGDYVLIAVTDTGSGMPAAVREQIFDPFFTTKSVGKGTGLGLSMVYGFVKQSEGHITVYSAEDKGTTIKLYLPRSHAAADETEAPKAVSVTPPHGETILVVEDDTDLRTLAVVILTDLGYRVLEAGSGPAALRLLEQETHVDLLLTDVVLPDGMDGKEVADAVRARIPTAKVHFMSGYATGAMASGGRLIQGEHLLQKPFDPKDLARQVKWAIDA